MLNEQTATCSTDIFHTTSITECYQFSSSENVAMSAGEKIVIFLFRPNPAEQNLEILDPTQPDPTQPNPIYKWIQSMAFSEYI